MFLFNYIQITQVMCFFVQLTDFVPTFNINTLIQGTFRFEEYDLGLILHSF